MKWWFSLTCGLSPQVPVKPGWISFGYPDLHLGQDHLRKWQEVHCHSLCGVFHPVELGARKGQEDRGLVMN